MQEGGGSVEWVRRWLRGPVGLPQSSLSSLQGIRHPLRLFLPLQPNFLTALSPKLSFNIMNLSTEKKSQPKSWGLYCIWWEFLGLQAWEAAFQVALRELLQGGRVEESGYIDVCNKGQVVWTLKVFLWIKENQLSQVKEFSTFLYMARCKPLSSLKSFLSYVSQLSGASVLWFFISWVLLSSP